MNPRSSPHAVSKDDKLQPQGGLRGRSVSPVSPVIPDFAYGVFAAGPDRSASKDRRLRRIGGSNRQPIADSGPRLPPVSLALPVFPRSQSIRSVRSNLCLEPLSPLGLEPLTKKGHSTGFFLLVRFPTLPTLRRSSLAIKPAIRPSSLQGASIWLQPATLFDRCRGAWQWATPVPQSALGRSVATARQPSGIPGATAAGSCVDDAPIRNGKTNSRVRVVI